MDGGIAGLRFFEGPWPPPLSRNEPRSETNDEKTMKRRKIIGKFSEALIESYLSSKVYERRGWTREQYIERCKAVWRKTKYDPQYEIKIIIDFSEPVTVSQLFGVRDFDVDFVDGALSQQTVHGFEDKKDIECLTLFSGKLPTKDGCVDLVRIDEAFQPATLPTEKSTLVQGLYFIAFFDVLGFSNLVKEKGTENILATYQRLIELAVLKESYTAFGRVKLAQNHYLMGGSYAPINYTYFSDTILLWTTAYNTHVSPFLARCSDLICEALRIRMPLRGSVCFGEAVLDKSTNTFIGRAIIEANDIEKNQKWIGATLGSAFALSELKEALSETLVVPLYCEHFKPAMKLTFPYLTLDWVTRWKEKRYPDLLPILESLKENAPDINKVYYENTINFVHYASLDDLQERRIFLRAQGYHIEDVSKVDVQHLHMQLLVLKVLNEPPHAGFIFTFPKQMLQTSKNLRDLPEHKLSLHQAPGQK